MTIAPRIAIIGGGPGGLMLARLLQIRGLAPIVFERDAHADERPQGGSLDLHGDTGLRAIRLAGLEEEFLAHARPEDQGDRLYDPDGNILFDHDGEGGEERPEIDRTALRKILLDALAAGTVRWGRRIETIEPAGEGRRVIVNDAAEAFDIVVGADGAWSRVQPLLTDARPAYEGITFVEFGYDARLYPEIDELAGGGKMFAVGENRVLVAQRNGHSHVRGYAALRMPEAEARRLEALSGEAVRAAIRPFYRGWAPSLTRMIEVGDFIAVRSIYAMPVGHSWKSRPGLTMLGDAAHLMSPFAGEGVNLALADAADLAEAIVSGEGWPAVARAEHIIADRAAPAAAASHRGAEVSLSPNGVAPVLAHHRSRFEAVDQASARLSHARTGSS
jgi:2-polyprenyl-6-methoxyphenol hydroxylase-like FAD-dependent oxidoreductase